MRVPNDIHKTYRPVWDDMMKTRPWRDLSKVLRYEGLCECFRLMLQEAGTKQPVKHSVSTFVKFDEKAVRRYYTKLFKPLFKAVKPSSRVEYEDSTVTFSALTVNMQVNALLVSTLKSDVYSSNHFDPTEEALKKLDGLAWRVRPVKLSAYNYNGKPKKLKRAKDIKDADFHFLHSEKNFETYAARCVEGIVLRVNLFGVKASPKYKRFDSELKKIKEHTMRRIFQ